MIRGGGARSARRQFLLCAGALVAAPLVIVVAARKAAQAMRVELLFAEYSGHDFAPAFAQIEQQRPDALLASGDGGGGRADVLRHQ
jgi:hypothetical protein